MQDERQPEPAQKETPSVGSCPWNAVNLSMLIPSGFLLLLSPAQERAPIAAIFAVPVLAVQVLFVLLPTMVWLSRHPEARPQSARILGTAFLAPGLTFVAAWISMARATGC